MDNKKIIINKTDTFTAIILSPPPVIPSDPLSDPPFCFFFLRHLWRIRVVKPRQLLARETRNEGTEMLKEMYLNICMNGSRLNHCYLYYTYYHYDSLFIIMMLNISAINIVGTDLVAVMLQQTRIYLY